MQFFFRFYFKTISMLKFIAFATIVAADPTRFLSQSTQGIKPESFIETDPLAKAKKATAVSEARYNAALGKLRADAKTFQQEEQEFKERANMERKEANLIH